MQKLNPVRSNPPQTDVGLQADRTSNGVNRIEFEKIVKEGIKAIPEKFLRKLDNVAKEIKHSPQLDAVWFIRRRAADRTGNKLQ